MHTLISYAPPTSGFHYRDTPALTDDILPWKACILAIYYECHRLSLLLDKLTGFRCNYSPVQISSWGWGSKCPNEPVWEIDSIKLDRKCIVHHTIGIVIISTYEHTLAVALYTKYGYIMNACSIVWGEIEESKKPAVAKNWTHGPSVVTTTTRQPPALPTTNYHMHSLSIVNFELATFCQSNHSIKCTLNSKLRCGLPRSVCSYLDWLHNKTI